MNQIKKLIPLIEKSAVVNWNFYPIQLHNIAIGEEEGEATLYFKDTNLGGGSILDKQNFVGVETNNELDYNTKQNVKVETLDSFVREYDHFRLIKIDVEGFEAKVFKGAKRIIENYQVDYILFEAILEVSGYHAHKELMDTVEYIVKELKYDLCSIDRNGLCEKVNSKILVYITSTYLVLRSPYATDH